MIILIISAFLFQIVRNEIILREPSLSSFNAFQLNQIGIPFVVPLPLNANYYFKLTFTKSLHSTVSSSSKIFGTELYSSTQLNVQWSYYNKTSCSLDSSLRMPVSYGAISGSSPIYYIQPLTSSNLLQPLKALDEIGFWFTLTDSVIMKSAGNEIQAFKIEIVTTTDFNAIILDNSQFASFVPLTDEISTAKIDVIYDSDIKTAQAFNTQSVVFFDIALSKAISTPFTILIQIDNAAFNFLNSCSSVIKNSTTTVLPPSTYTCSIDTSSKNRIYFEINEKAALSFPLTLRVDSTVLNPPFILKNIGVSLYSLWKNKKKVVEYGQALNVFSVANVDLEYYTLLLSNLDLSKTSLPFAFGLIRSISTYKPYNSIRLTFKLKPFTFGSADIYRMVMKLGISGSEILEGSIQSNFSTSSGICSFDSLNVIIYCEGSGVTSSKEYYIGFRMSLPYDLGENSIQISTSFSLSMEFRKGGSFDSLNPLFSDFRATNIAELKTFNTKDYQPTGATFGKVVVSTQPLTSGIQAPTSVGIDKIGSFDRLVLNLKAAYSEFTSTSSVASTTITNKAGFYVLLPKQFTSNNQGSFGYKNDANTVHASGSATFTTFGSNLNNDYSLITFSASLSNALLELFPAAAADKAFGFENIKVNSECSLRVDTGNLCDIYIIPVDSLALEPYLRVTKGYFLVNAFSQDTSAFANINIGISNYFANSTNGNDATQAPVLLRVFGTFVTAETFNDSSIVVLGSFSNPITKSGNSVYCTNGEGASCISYSNTFPTTNQVLQLPRIEAIVNVTSKILTLAIPMTNVKSSATLDVVFYIGLLKRNTVSNLYEVFKISRKFSYSLLTQQVATLSNPSFGITGISKKVGEVSTASLTTSFGTGTPVANTGNSQGAGFFCAYSFNFIESNTTIPTSSMSPSTDPCFTFNYVLSAKNYFGLFCPFTSALASITVPNFRFPSDIGSVLNGFCGYSENNGLQTFGSVKADANIIQNPNSLSSPSLNPSTFVSNADFQFIQFSYEIAFNLICPIQIKLNFATSASPSYGTHSTCSLVRNGNETFACKFIGKNAEDIILELAICSGTGKFVISLFNVKFSSSTSTVTVKASIYAPSTANANFLVAESTGVSMTVATNSISQAITMKTLLKSNISAIRQTLEISILIGRPVYKGDSIILSHSYTSNFGFGNAEKNCGIYDANSDQTDLVLALISDSVSFKFFFNKEILTDTTLKLICKNFELYNAIISGTLRANDNLNVITFSTEISNLTTAMIIAPSSIIVNKAISSGIGHSIYLKITFPLQLIKNTNFKRLILSFPMHYTLSYLNCKINSLSTICTKTTSSSITIKTPFNLPTFSSIQLEIQGPYSNSIISSNPKFQALFDDDEDDSKIVEFGIFGDVTNNSLKGNISKIFITGVSYSSLAILGNVDLDINLTMDSTISKSNFLLFNLDPQLFANGISAQIPNCQLTYKSILISSQCLITGLMFNISLLTKLLPSEIYTLKITNLIAPDFTTCNEPKYMVSAVLDDGVSCEITAASFISTSSIDKISFLIPRSSEELIYNGGEVSVANGVFSSNIQVKAKSGVFKRDFYLDLISSVCDILPNPIQIRIDSTSANFSVGCFINNTISSRLIKLTKYQDGGVYANPPYVVVNANPTKPTFSGISTLTLPNQAIETYLRISLPYVPLESVNFTLTFANDSAVVTKAISLSFNKSVITKVAKIEFTAGTKNSTIIGNYSISSLFTLSSPSLTITFQNYSEIAPNIESGLVSNATENGVNLWGKCDLMGVVFYRVFSSLCDFNTNATNILENSLNNVKTQTEFCDEQYELKTLSSNATNNSFVISGLKSNFNYSATFYCRNSAGVFSNPNTTAFVTKSNGGKIFRLELAFAAAISFGDEERIVCFLSTYFKVQGNLIRSSNDIFCPFSNSRLLQSNSSSNISNTSNTSSTTNSSSTNTTANSTVLYKSLINFLQNYYLSNDSMLAKVEQEVATNGNLSSYIVGNVTGLQKIVSMTLANNISNVVCTLLPGYSLQVISNSLILYNLNVSAPCFVYYSLYENVTNITAPLDIRKGINASKYGRVFVNTIANVTFSSLKGNQVYYLKVVPSSQDPSIISNYGSVIDFSKITESLANTSYSINLKFCMGMMILFGITLFSN